MSAASAIDVGLGVLVVLLAGWSVLAREAFGAIVGFIACGLILALVWMRLAAPDVAMTESAIGSGLSGMLLLGTLARLRSRERTAGVPESPVQAAGFPAVGVVAGVLCAVVTIVLALVVLGLPDPAPSLAPNVAAHLAATGLENSVTGVLIAFRGLDTMLEKVVLVLALVGVWSLAENTSWGRAGVVPLCERSGPLTLLAQVLPPIGILVGIYLFWNGSTAPGGVFPGGTVLAAMWLLAAIAGLVRPPALRRRAVRLTVIVGPAVFIVVALAGFGLAGAFLAYPLAYAKAIIVVVEAALLVSIAATLAFLMVGPPDRAGLP